MTRILRFASARSLRCPRSFRVVVPKAYSSMCRAESAVARAGRAIPAARAFSTGTSLEEFNLADIGEGIAEVEVLQWYIKEGDTIEMFDKVCEVQSDKATVDISSKYDGVIDKLHYEVGDMAAVGAPLITVRVEGGATEEAPEQEGPTAAADGAAEQAPSPVRAATSPGKALATPAVRRVAREYDVDISKIDGTGKGGRVLKEDVLRFVGAIGPAKVKATAKPAGEPAAPPEPIAAAPARAATTPVADEVLPLRGFGRIMANTMTESLKIPHFFITDEVEASGMIALRSELKPIAEARGIKFSYMPLMFKAASLALQRYPYVNATIADDLSTVTLRARHNIGFACATDTGLVVPVIKDCQEKSVFDIAQDMNRLVALARDNKLDAQDVSDGTFSLSNIGSIGGIYGGPIITSGQAAIGAVGKMRTLPRFDEDGNVYPANIVNISWSGDHRVLDGATMTHFSNAWIEYLEKPQLMMCDMR